jgi:hypothetical protein
VAATPVYLEVGTKRVFACALRWPGWARSGKNEELALEALAAYVPRFAVVAAEAGLRLPSTAGRSFEVVERVPGSATTDFGAPGAVASADKARLKDRAVDRVLSLVRASWVIFDRVVAGAPAELRKGPRGGGRDRDKIVEHVLGAESGYCRQIGLRLPQPDPADTGAVAEFRDQILDALPTWEPPGPKKWPARYAARRIAWHALDHAWEIEDRSEPAPAA